MIHWPNFFQKREYMTQPTTIKNDYYTVGVDQEGYTVIKIHFDGGGVTTMSMSSSGVRQMIRLLEATLEEEEENNNE
jgi:hypothetical protein